MIRNYFLVALRNLTRNRFFSAINIFGLAVSMSICLGIIMLVADQLSYDKYNKNHERVYRVVTTNMNPDGSPAGNQYATSPLPLAQSLSEGHTAIEKTARIRRGFGNGWIEFEQDVNIPLAGFFAEETALDIFQLELEHGDARTALKEPYSVVLTKAASKKLFTKENPVGEIIKVGELGEYKVTGVLKDDDRKSHIVFEALASYSTIPSLEAKGTFGNAETWEDFTSGWVYFLMKEDAEKRSIENYLNEVAKKVKPTSIGTNKQLSYRFSLQNICEITPGPFINNAIGPFMPMLFVYFFGGLALIVMLTSCFNYTNLSIARSLNRAREIGVRKVNGASRSQIFLQFLAESIVLSLIALSLSLLLLVAVKPFLLNLRFAQVLRWDVELNVYVYAVFLAFSLVIGIMAGFFPAVVLSKFQPVKVLKSAGSIKLFSKLGLRKSLLVIQFSLSLIFIISVILLHNQLNLFINADHGFVSTDKVVVKLNNTSHETLSAALRQQSNIINVAPSSHVPATGMTYGENFKTLLSDEEGRNLDYYYVDHNYIANMGLRLLAGRNFSEEAGNINKNYLIINESALQVFKLGSPYDALGKHLFLSADSSQHEIIGVVKDYNHQVLMTEIKPMALRYNADEFNILQVQYSGTYEEASRAIEASWASVNPTMKISYKAFDEEIGFFYETVFSDFVSIIGILALLAIVISCLGLLGMATYTIETRLKEISIRKVLGSTDGALVYLLSKSFLILLGIAVLIAVPLAWFINNLWLQMIAYHTEMSITVVAMAVLVLGVLAAITIGSQTIRAAFANPVDNLKNE